MGDFRNSIMKNLVILNIVLFALVAVGLLLLPSYLTSPIVHSQWFRSIVNIFDTDTRVVVEVNTYPWTAIGLVHGNPADCTQEIRAT